MLDGCVWTISRTVVVRSIKYRRRYPLSLPIGLPIRQPSASVFIVMSSSSSAESVARVFGEWARDQERQHRIASKTASLDVESRFLLPLESAAVRLVQIWVDAVKSTATNPGIDVKSLLVKEDIHKLIAYLHRNNSSYYDVSLFDKAWAHYKTECGRMGKWRFDACRSSEPTCIKDFFDSITLENMFDAFENLVGDASAPEFWQAEFRIFWLLRTRCGLESDERAMDPIMTKGRTISSVGQRTAIEDAARADDGWAVEFEQFAGDFARFGADMKKIAMTTHLARLQINIAHRFADMLDQFSASNNNSLAEHEDVYSISRDIGVATCHSLVLDRVQSSLVDLVNFVTTPNRRIDAISVYMERAVSSMVAPIVQLADVSIAYAKVLQEYEIASHSSHNLNYSRISLEQLDKLINGLFPVPSGLSDEFSSVLQKTIELHGNIATLHTTIVERIDAGGDALTLEDTKAKYGEQRVTLHKEAVVVDADSFMKDVYTTLQSRIDDKENLHAVRLFIETRLSYISRDDYVLEQQHMKATTKLKEFDKAAIAYLQLKLTSNASIVAAKTKLSVQAKDVLSHWTSALGKWQSQYDRVPPVYIFPTINKNVVASWTMRDDAIKQLQHLILSKSVHSYVNDFIDLYTELAASGKGDASDALMQNFGLQASIMSDTLGNKRSTHGLTFGQMVRGIEVVMLTTTQTQVIVDASKTISEYSPSIDASMDT